jgi:hypothetical protein
MHQAMAERERNFPKEEVEEDNQKEREIKIDRWQCGHVIVQKRCLSHHDACICKDAEKKIARGVAIPFHHIPIVPDGRGHEHFCCRHRPVDEHSNDDANRETVEVNCYISVNGGGNPKDRVRPTQQPSSSLSFLLHRSAKIIHDVIAMLTSSFNNHSVMDGREVVVTAPASYNTRFVKVWRGREGGRVTDRQIERERERKREMVNIVASIPQEILEREGVPIVLPTIETLPVTPSHEYYQEAWAMIMRPRWRLSLT